MDSQPEFFEDLLRCRVFLNGAVIQKIIGSFPGHGPALGIYILLCGMASEIAGGRRFQLDVEYLATKTNTTAKTVRRTLASMHRLGVVDLDGADMTIAWPNEQQQKEAKLVGFGPRLD
jgi:hypothetical protein